MSHQVPACLLAVCAPTALISEIVLEKGLYRLQMVQMDFLISYNEVHFGIFFLLSYIYVLSLHQKGLPELI